MALMSRYSLPRAQLFWDPRREACYYMEVNVANCCLGMYVCWAVGRGGTLAAGWARGGRAVLAARAALWARVAARAALAALALLGLIPLMFGLLLELVTCLLFMCLCIFLYLHVLFVIQFSQLASYGI